MRCLLLALLLGGAAPVIAQPGSAPYPLAPGEQVRVALAPTSDLHDGSLLVGQVLTVGADSLMLAHRPWTAPQALPWTHVLAVERHGDNTIGEALGMLAGGIGGGLAGYLLGRFGSDDPLAVMLLVPGSVGGLVVGGVIGAHTGDRWHDVPLARPPVSLRATIPLR